LKKGVQRENPFGRRKKKIFINKRNKPQYNLLPPYIIHKIDEPIRDVVVEINKLYFVKSTHASCSGHEERPSECPYIDIEFKLCPHTAYYIELFIKDIEKIKGANVRDRKRNIVHIAFEWDGSQENLNYVWSNVRKIIKIFQNYAKPNHSCF